MERVEVYQLYNNKHDITTIFEDTFRGDELIATEVKGFYYGEPNEDDCKTFNGKLKATYEEE